MAPQIPKTHKAALFKEQGGPLHVEEVETKLPQEGEVLVKVLACGVCHSEVIAQQNMFGVGFPHIPGHEVIGDVAAVGPGEKNWKIGDRVGAAWHGGHDEKAPAKHADEASTKLVLTYKSMVSPGMVAVSPVVSPKTDHLRDAHSPYNIVAEYCTVRTEAVVDIPTELDPADSAPFLCAGVTVFNSMRQMKVLSGEVVAVQGLGGLGHLAIQYANKMGYRVVALSSSGAKEKFAKDLGAHVYVDGSKENHAEALKKLGGASIILSTAPIPEIMGGLVSGLGPQGKLIVLAPIGEIKIDTLSLISNGSSVQGWPSGQALDCEEAVEFAQLHNIKCMVEKFPLDKANDAFDHMMSGKARFRAVITMT